MHLLTHINGCNAFLGSPHSQAVGLLLDEVPKREVIFFFFPKEATKKKKKKLLAECFVQTKQKTEKFTVHRCTRLGSSPRARAKESWLTVDCGCQGTLVFGQGQTITLSLGGQLQTQPSQCVCVCVCVVCR